MLAKKYLEKGVELLQRLQETQLENIERAAEMIASAVADGHTLYAWGGPHSSLPVQDIFWRAGGLALVNPLFTPGLSLETGPIYLTSALERTEGLGREYFDQVGAEPGDVIILVSTSGRNPFPIEMAMAARQAGLKVIGLTSLTYTRAVTSRHSSGKKMADYCDVVIDNLTAPGDAILEDERLPQKVGPTSGWMGCLILQALMAEVAEQLAEKEVVPPIYFALNLDGQEDYVQYMDNLRRERGTRFGGIYSPRRAM
ncbi:MAG: SIS domain-containing protein [Anaerolineae bacterium]